MTSRSAALMIAAVAAVATAASLAGGCSRREHLVRGYGVSREAFRAQRAVQEPSGAPDVTGLDSQEAAIIADGYRRSLAPKGAQVEEEPVILLAPQKPVQRAPLPPSVPK
jgi:hypothetical protein